MTNQLKPFAFCSFCGGAFGDTGVWPRSCPTCNNVTYRNPLPVSVAVIPIIDGAGQGILTIRRAIEPRKGQLALPGGFINWGESWQAAAAREVLEETGLVIQAERITEFAFRSAPDGTLLVFGLAEPVQAADLSEWSSDGEASERVIILKPTELAFPLHTDVVNFWFDTRSKG